MIGFLRLHPLIGVLMSVAAVVVVGAVIATGVLSRAGELPDPAGAPTSARPSSPTRVPSPTPGAEPAGCSGSPVSTGDQLESALASARPGDVIALAPGTFSGNFVAQASGTADKPITVCGTADSILDGGRTGKGYVFHLDDARYWVLSGFTVTNGQKGVVADGTVGSVIENLTVNTIGDEAIHLRRFSTDNRVTGNTISGTGLRKPKFGEGIYIGTAESNWCDISQCAPDNSDRNVIDGNTIGETTSESVDIKEGTTGGVLSNNTFDGTSIVGADSWVDVKGNGWLIEGNRGTNSPEDGFQTHEIIDGWGDGNVFRDNAASVNGPGFGFSLAPVLGNVVECNNRASGAGEGLSNVSCTG